MIPVEDKMISGVTFDVYRTLIYIENRQTYWRESSEFLLDQGIEVYPQELEASRNFVFMVDLPIHQFDNWYDWTNQILFRLNVKKPREVVVNGLSEILKKSVDNYRLYEDVKAVFENIRPYNLKCSALTTIPEFKLRSVLSPIRDDLMHIMHGGNSGCVKGNPSMYLQDLQLKGIKPNENLFVGDDPYYDIEIPSKLGQLTVHIEREHLPIASNYSVNQITSLVELPISLRNFFEYLIYKIIHIFFSLKLY